MHDKKTFMGRVAAVILLLSVLASFYVAALRWQAESDYNRVTIAVDMNDVESFANARDISKTEVLQEMKGRGVSQILFKEMSLGILETAGSIEILQGERLMQSPDYPAVADAIAISPADLYILIKDPELAEQLEAHVLAKVPGSRTYDTEPLVLGVPTMIPSSQAEAAKARASLLDIGVGFDEEAIDLAVAQGLGPIPQIRSWLPVDDASMKLLKDELRAMPNIDLLMFNDKQIPGYPDELDVLEAALADEEGQPYAPLVTIEFNDQKGLVGLAERFDKQVVRLHTISNSEMSRFEEEGSPEELERGLAQALDRWELAVDERNMRCLLVRFFQIEMPYESYDFNLDYLSALSQDLEKRAYAIKGAPQSLDSVQVSPYLTMLIGLGVAAGFVLLLLYLGLPRLALAGGILAAVAWLGLYQMSATWAVKIMSLASVVIFPTLSCAYFLETKPMRAGPAIGRLLAMSGASLIGAVLMVGMMSNTGFMLKLDQFAGVKLAHALPLLLVPFILYIWRQASPMQAMRSLWQQTINYKWALIFGMIAVALVIYLGRTGNESTQVSDLELIFRQFLSDSLLVRPRSKEFLIGYPATLLFFRYYSDRAGAWFLTIPAIIGQVSLINTYAHIHTPLAASLLRSFNGLWLGIVVGLLSLWFFGRLRRCWATMDPFAQQSMKKGGPCG